MSDVILAKNDPVEVVLVIVHNDTVIARILPLFRLLRVGIGDCFGSEFPTLSWRIPLSVLICEAALRNIPFHPHFAIHWLLAKYSTRTPVHRGIGKL